MSNGKQKPIDLGQLQDTYNSAKKQFQADTKALERAQQAFDKSKGAYGTAYQDLKSATRVVLE